jgi:hypothetical protein
MPARIHAQLAVEFLCGAGKKTGNARKVNFISMKKSCFKKFLQFSLQ